MSVLERAKEALEAAQPMGVRGRVMTLRGTTLLVSGLALPVGSVVRVRGSVASRDEVLGEVVGLSDGRAIVMLMGRAEGIRAGDPVEALHALSSIAVGPGFLGRVIDAMGRPLDGREAPRAYAYAPLDARRLSPMRREPIATPLRTGVRSIDLFTPVGRGQRMGIFAGPGVGKSTLLGQITRQTDADVVVVALLGERGREVREFIEDALGPQGLARSVIVCATADESPLLRARAARSACAVAEHFRDEGHSVLLVMDSLTRYAHALRQIGLAAGEPPTSRGYTPGVFASMAELLERAGAVDIGGGRVGSITGLYTVLVEGDDFNEPVSDAVRGVLDGHVQLSRSLATRGHFPAVDVLGSISRLATRLMDPRHAQARGLVLRLLAEYAQSEDLVRIGAYAKGSSREVDAAIALMPEIDGLLRQETGDDGQFGASREMLLALGDHIAEVLGRGG
ncbi:MAG: FliI/YscN family ATPase [Phycisphaeraceae bacterium]|nr:FliI/YscN family ATPase [Phycisphaeraceae bacterium]